MGGNKSSKEIKSKDNYRSALARGLESALEKLGLKNDKLEKKTKELENALQKSAEEQAKKLQEIQAKHDEVTRQIEEQHKLAIEEFKYANKAELDELKKLLEQKNYESYFAKPPIIKQHHLLHPNSFNIQILGSRGVGKSTFINHVLKDLGISGHAEAGQNETTLQTRFFDLTEKINPIGPYKEVFIVDQPGIGGQKITEASYLHKFGPGHFDMTLLLCDKGFNENETKLLRHLVHNKCELIIVRTFCGQTVENMVADAEDQKKDLSNKEAFEQLKSAFRTYMTDVLEKYNAAEILHDRILFLGRRRTQYPDFAFLVDAIKSGGLIKMVVPQVDVPAAPAGKDEPDGLPSYEDAIDTSKRHMSTVEVKLTGTISSLKVKATGTKTPSKVKATGTKTPSKVKDE